MLTKKDNVVAPIVGSSLIVEPDSMANVAPDVVPSIEIEPRADLYICKVSESPLCPPLGSLPTLSSSPFYSESQRDSFESSSSSAPT